MLTTSSSGFPFVASKRYYFDDFERNINTENGAITDLDYIFADGRPVALVRTTGGSKTCYGVMTDRLGSLMSLYTAEGFVQKFSYDAWGNRRNPHAKLSGFYPSKPGFTNGFTVREWLKTQNYEEQYKFGVKTLKNWDGNHEDNRKY